MRIVSGKYKNRVLKSPGDGKTHPMGERERNAIFNSLGDITGLRVLDLFAGTGALGLESISRGAYFVTFVERSPASLVSNIRSLALPPASYEISRADATKFSSSTPFDLIFCDPPYDSVHRLDFSFLLPLLSPTSVLVLSLPKNIDISLPPLDIFSDKTYANCRIILAHLPK